MFEILLTFNLKIQTTYKQTSNLRDSAYGTVTDTPELLHASYLKDVYSQVECPHRCTHTIRGCDHIFPTLDMTFV